MNKTSIANFTIITNADYTISAPTSGKLLNTANGDDIDFTVNISKENSTLSITPALFDANQKSGNYSSNLTLTVAAI